MTIVFCLWLKWWFLANKLVSVDVYWGTLWYMGTCIYTSFWIWTKEILEVGWPSHTVLARTLPILAIYLYKTDWTQLTRNFTRNCIVCCFDIVLKVSVKPLDLLNELVWIFSDTHLVTVFLKHIPSNNLYLLWWYEEVPRLCYCLNWKHNITLGS